MRADLVAERDARARCHHDVAPISIPSAASGGIRCANQLDRVGVDRRRRQAVADHDRKLARPARHGSPVSRREAGSSMSPEIGTPEIIAAGRGPGWTPRSAQDQDRARSRDQARRHRSAACTASRARAWSSVKSSSASVGRLAPARPSPTRAGVSSPQIAQRTGRRRRRVHPVATRREPRPRAAGSNSSRRSAGRRRPRART